MLVNAQHVKNVPGRKTDVKDAQWLATLLRVGLLRASFVPPKEIRALRDLTRYRTQVIRQRAQECNRIQKLFGGRQHQAGRRRHGHPGGQRPGHAAGAG
jgi:transposase